MAKVLALRAHRGEPPALHFESLLFEPMQEFVDSDLLLAHVKRHMDDAMWVAIWPDVANASDIAGRIRQINARANVVLVADAGAQDLLDEVQKALEAVIPASIGSPAAMLAHKIGTPMTSIQGYAELLAKSVGDEKNRTRANHIVDQVQRVSELLEALLGLPSGERRTDDSRRSRDR